MESSRGANEPAHQKNEKKRAKNRGRANPPVRTGTDPYHRPMDKHGTNQWTINNHGCYDDGAITCQEVVKKSQVSKWSQEVQIKKYCLRAIYVPTLFASIICHCNLRAGTICQHYLPFYLMLHHCLLTLTWCAYVPHDQPLFITENDSMQQVQCNMMSIVNFFNRENY